MFKGLDLFVVVFENEGVECIFGIFGEENFDVVELFCYFSIELVIICYEQVVVFMVVIYGCLIGKLGVCLVMFGLGVFNFIIGVVYVLFGVWLVIMIIGQKGIVVSKQVCFQIVDIVGMMKLLIKQVWQIVLVCIILIIVCEVFCVVQEECLGLVLLEFFEDIVVDEVEGVVLVLLYVVDCFIVSLEVLDWVVEIICNVWCLLLMIVLVVLWLQFSEVLLVFVLCVGILFFIMQMGKGVVVGGLGLYMGIVVFIEYDYVYMVIDQVDVIVIIGYEVIEKLLFVMCLGGLIVIYIGYLQVVVEQVYFLQVEVIGDIGCLLI